MEDQTRMCCETCRFGVKVGGGKFPKFIGCHRFPPAAEVESPLENYGASKFPLLQLNAFCWEWSAKIEGAQPTRGNFLVDMYD